MADVLYNIHCLAFATVSNYFELGCKGPMLNQFVVTGCIATRRQPLVQSVFFAFSFSDGTFAFSSTFSVFCFPSLL